MKDKHGNNISTEREQTVQWVEHFREVLNRPEPDDPAEIDPSDVLLDIDISPPSKEEVKTAIKALKNGKACGVDSIHAEMLKADIETSAEVLTDFFHSIWASEETIPEDWARGLIVKSGHQQEDGNPVGQRPPGGEPLLLN